MRIALFHNLPSGGAKRTLYESAKRLAASHQVDVYTLTCAEHDFADLRPHVAGHKAFEFRPLPLLSPPLGRLNQAIRLADLKRLDWLARDVAREMELGGYDVLLAHPCQLTQSALVLRHRGTLPTVYYCQEPPRMLYDAFATPPQRGAPAAWWQRTLNRIDPLPAWYRAVLKRMDQENTRSADLVLVNSEFMRDAVRGIYGVGAHVSYHGVDTHRFRPLPAEKQYMVLSVGALAPLKGFDFLVRAVACISGEVRPALVIASNFQWPPEKAYLEELAEDLGVGLRLLANLSDEQLVQLYNEATLTVYAPVREPFGLVPLESMACGTPVVAVGDGGVNETVRHEETGLLTERDPHDFAEAVLTLLRDPMRRKQYGHQARIYVENEWGWDRAVRNLENHLARVTRRPGNKAVG